MWAIEEWSSRSSLCDSFSRFSEAFSQIFQTVSPGQEAARSLISLRQGRRTVTHFATEFQTLATVNGWNESALINVFLRGLSAKIKDLLVSLEVPKDLDSLIALTSVGGFEGRCKYHGCQCSQKAGFEVCSTS